MRILGPIGNGILFSLLSVVSACAFDVDEDQPLQQASEEGLAISNPDAPAELPTDETGLSTPTCNWVASYAGAWVPYFSGPPGTVDCNMVRGCNSAAVRQLQHSMNVCYGEHLTEDGDFGLLTEQALIRTQKKAGTTADGGYGPNTRKAMLHEPVSGGPCVRVP
ncbi:MAG TPA: peptidoglycan-binding domain-containing protein [Kofleriaceae bacterium]|nr:peptidoglycan-binding domain-containing protein [Kofleriaceae bacterium]